MLGVAGWATVMFLWGGTVTGSLLAEVTTSFTEPDVTIEVACAETGVVSQVFVKPGQTVEAGTVLAVLDNAVLEASLRAAEAKAQSTARVDLARVEVDLKKRQMERLSRVLKDGHASANEIEKAEAELASSEAQLRIAEEERKLHQFNVEQIKAQLDRRTIRCPINGVATRVHRRPGEFLSGNGPVIATVVRIDHLRVKFYVSTEMAEQLASEQECGVLIRGKRHLARIDFLSPVTDADSGTVRLEVLLDNQIEKLRSGIPSELEAGQPVAVPMVNSEPLVP